MTVELSWTTRTLRSLAVTAADTLVAGFFHDERPVRGVCGLVDWRLGGAIDQLCVDEFVTGELHESLLMPGHPRFPVDKILMVGLGASEAYGDDRFVEALETILGSLAQLKARRVCIELPGRHAAKIDAGFAFDQLAKRVHAPGGTRPIFEFDAVILIDDIEAHRVFHDRRNKLAKREPRR